MIIYLEFHNFFHQDKALRILVLSTKSSTRWTHSKIFTYVFLTKKFLEMKQNNKSVKS